MELKDNIAYKILESRNAYKLLGNINTIYDCISPLLEEIRIFFSNYTLHDAQHSIRVLNYMCQIAGYECLKSLTNLELAMIIYSAILHDVGMWISEEEKNKIFETREYSYFEKINNGNEELALQDYIRKFHGKRSYSYIISNPKLANLMCDNELPSVSYAEDVALICQSHMRSLNWINDNLKENFTKGEFFNGRFIALLLRIADYIDYDCKRAPEYLFFHKTNMPQISKDIWFGHLKICNREKVNVESHNIFFTIECDDFYIYCSLMKNIELIETELKECVRYSSLFSDKKYRLNISEHIQLEIKTIGFEPEISKVNIDYDKITSLLMGEQLYRNRKYGLREILQNSFDACNLMSEIYERIDITIPYNPKISIIYDYDNGTVAVRDNGTGMSKEIIDKYFLSIGSSYYQSNGFKEQGYSFAPRGYYGIGFFSCFMISDRIKIKTKHYKDANTYCYFMRKGTKYLCKIDEQFVGPHGTEITFLMEDFDKVFPNKDFLSPDFKMSSWSDASDLFQYINDLIFKLNDIEISIICKQNKEIQMERNLSDYFIDKRGDDRIDLSQYLYGIECHVIMDYFIYPGFPKIRKWKRELMNCNIGEIYYRNFLLGPFSHSAFSEIVNIYSKEGRVCKCPTYFSINITGHATPSIDKKHVLEWGEIVYAIERAVNLYFLNYFEKLNDEEHKMQISRIIETRFAYCNPYCKDIDI